MALEVTCYAGHKGDQRPVRFRLGDSHHFVEEVVDQWYGPEHEYFRVKVEDGAVYVLRRSLGSGGDWSLESERR